MFKPLIAGIAALSISLVSPAQANGLDREDVGKLLIGLAAIAVIGAAVEQNDRRENRSTPAHDRNRGSWSDLPDRNNDWSNLPRRNDRRVIPGDCLRHVETRFGTQRMFGRRCLQRNYHHFSSLPDRCAVRVYTNDGPRRGYDPLCLRQQGYRSDRRW